MEKRSIVKLIADDFNLNSVEKAELGDFLTKNNDLPEMEFYKKLNDTFPWFDIAYKHQNSKYLGKISKHVSFFYVVTIIYLVITGIAILVGLISLSGKS